MSRLVISYGDLDNSADYAKKLSSRIEDYAESLESRVSRKISSYSGERTQNIYDADGFMRKKLEKLRMKKIDFATLSTNIKTFESNCKNADKNVASVIKTLSGSFRRVYAIKDNIVSEFFNYLSIKLGNSNVFGRAITNGQHGVKGFLKSPTEKIKAWYKNQGSKLIALAMAATGLSALCNIKANQTAKKRNDLWARRYSNKDSLAKMLKKESDSKLSNGFTNAFEFVEAGAGNVILTNLGFKYTKGSVKSTNYIYSKKGVTVSTLSYKSGKFKIGKPSEPEIKFDDDFKYDKNEKATAKDRVNWVEWGAKLEAAKILRPDLKDGTEAYEHYRDGSGTTLKINYEKAYKEDNVIKKYVDEEIRKAQKAVEELAEKSGLNAFEITGKATRVPNGDSENWQKTIGAHSIWSSAEVTYKDGKYTMVITIHEKDKYNFNKGMSDIASGAPDNENGRFEVLGWAKSFETEGEIKRTVTWDAGEINDSTKITKESSKR